MQDIFEMTKDIGPFNTELKLVPQLDCKLMEIHYSGGCMTFDENGNFLYKGNAYAYTLLKLSGQID